MAISVFDLFKVGIGPSSSHTVGPMRAAKLFAIALQKSQLLDTTATVKIELFGSLGATGKGHGSDICVMLGLMGHAPDTVDVDAIPELIQHARSHASLALLATRSIAFREKDHLLMYRREAMAEHPNGMQFSAWDVDGSLLRQTRYLSVGGGFVVTVGANNDKVLSAYQELPHPFTSGDQLLGLCRHHGMTISQLMLANELMWRTEDDIRSQLLQLWQTMRECVQRGLVNEGTLPGPFKVPRRAPVLAAQLQARAERTLTDPLSVMDWVNV